MKKLEELGISPAPWEVFDYGHFVAASGQQGNRRIVAMDVRSCDLNLIASAPDLYDAAERLLRFHDESCIHGNRTFEEITRDYVKAMEDLRTALAEAAGESEVGK